MGKIRIWMLMIGLFTLGALFGAYVMVGSGSGGEARAKPPLAKHQELSRPFIETAENVSPTVVTISTEQLAPEAEDPLRDDWFDGLHPRRRRTRRGLGSGVLVRRDKDVYYILTNSHVVAKADKMTVELDDESRFVGHRVGVDTNTDIAVIRIEVKGKDLPLARMADSDAVRVGQEVLAIGAPHGLKRTVTHGIVSATGRANEAVALLPDFLQTDAPINPGNSGGPLVDLSGKVIGINTWISSKSGGSQGLGFAVPSNLAKKVMEFLIRDGKVTRAYIGVYIANLTEKDVKALQLADRHGARITGVIAKSPAKKAGLRRGDVVVAVNGKAVRNRNALIRLVALRGIGTKVKLDIVRAGKKLQIEVSLASLPTAKDR